MGHASRSTRGQFETESLSAVGSEDRLFERKSNKPSVHSDVVEQPNAKVRRLFIFFELNAECGCVQGLGRTETPKGSGASIVVFFFHCRMISVLTASGQAQRNGVLEFDLQEVGLLDKLKWGNSATTLRADCKHDKAVTSASWDPRGRSIVSTCYDDALRCM